MDGGRRAGERACCGGQRKDLARTAWTGPRLCPEEHDGSLEGRKNEGEVQVLGRHVQR